MSEYLVNKWLKKDEQNLEKDKKKLEEEKKELVKAVETMLVDSFKISMDDGLLALAKIHHSLFTSAVTGSEKGSNALFHLRNNLSKLILKNNDFDLGIFLIHYSKHWFRLYLILESRAQEYISWVANLKEGPINFRKILSELNDSIQIDYSIIEENHRFYNSIKLELKDLENQVTVESAKKLRNLIQNTLRMYLTNDDYKQKLQFIAFFISKSFEHEVTVQELIHEFSKDWFRRSLEFKRWFHIFLENLNPELEYKMFKGYNWMKLDGKPLKTVIKTKNHIK